MSHINRQRVTLLCDEVGRDMLAMLFKVFSEELAEYVQCLDQDASLANIADVCHAAKSSARSFGADLLAEQAIHFEQQAKQSEQLWLKEHLPQLRNLLLQSAEDYAALASDEKALDRLLQ
ncbi:hypothetical protein VST7929_01178 [Vibrio stylophorae]|uniref:HPt domain-containing protein n=1 Tax=Vibrio stylophorae TaxID=659351 RepID=A0ABN8DSJ7_9VIBR|nr:Hpt domain-containing protein [Vibrio stylophorae]CAH0533313.1 hypothetical protein VST7929_01178 [Vibrio stylophorae]